MDRDRKGFGVRKSFARARPLVLIRRELKGASRQSIRRRELN
jgi:hypothetical protein